MSLSKSRCFVAAAAAAAGVVVVVDTSFLMLTSSAFLHHLFLTTEDTHLGPNMEDSLDVEQSLGPSQVGKMVIDPSRVIQLLVKGQNK